MAFLDNIKDYWLGNSQTGEVGALSDNANNGFIKGVQSLGFGNQQFDRSFQQNTPIRQGNPIANPVNPNAAAPQMQVSQPTQLPQMPGLPQARNPNAFLIQPNQQFQSGMNGVASQFQNPFGSANFNTQQPSQFGGNFNGVAGQVQQGLNGIKPYNPITNQYAMDQRQTQDNNYNQINQDYRGQHLDNFLNADNLQDFFRGAIVGHQDRADMARSTDLLKQNNTISEQNIENLNNNNLSDIQDQRKSVLGLGALQNSGNEVQNNINKTNADIQNQGFNQNVTSYDKNLQQYQQAPLMQAQQKYNQALLNPRQYTIDEIKSEITPEQDSLYQQKFGKNYLSDNSLVGKLRENLQQRDQLIAGRQVGLIQNPSALFQGQNPNAKIETSNLTNETKFSGDLNPQSLPQLIKLKQQFDAATLAQQQAGSGIPVLGSGQTIVK